MGTEHKGVAAKILYPNTLCLTGGEKSREDPLIAQQHYRQLLDHCPDMILVHEDGRFVYINPAGIRWLGGTSEEQFIGRRVHEIVHPDEISKVMARIASLRHVGEISGPAPETLLRLDGTTFDAEATSVLTRWKEKLAYLVILRDANTQKSLEKTLRYQAGLVNHVNDAVIATTVTGIVTSWNPAAETIYRRPAAKALGLPISEVVKASLDPAAIISQGGALRATHHTSDGIALSVRVSASARDNGFVLVCTDQTAPLQAEEHFQTVVASLSEGVVVLSNDGRVKSVNPAALRILGVDSNDPVYDETKRIAMIPIIDIEGRLLSSDQRALTEFLQTQPGQTSRILGIDRPGDGQRVWLSVNAQLLTPESPQNSSMLISFMDITTQHTASQKLAYRATHDALTELPNRAQILSQMSAHIGEGSSARCGAALYIDLDNFKEINDTLGHDVGDIMLKTAAQRLRAALRAGDAVGRLGGDEFVALIPNEITQAELDQLTERIHTILGKPIQCGDTELTIRASIGIANILKNDPRKSSQIMRDAETAMYEAKSFGGKTSCYFTFQPEQRNNVA